jgi:hypothetical protein
MVAAREPELSRTERAAAVERDARAPGPSARGSVAVIAAGIFVTGLGWPGLIGRLPFGLLLKNQLHLPAEDVAVFWAVSSLPWYVKPLVGLIGDAYPLFGTRRRGYLLAGGGLAGLCWLAVAVVPRAYLPLLAVMVALNLALVFISTTVGGLLVETGQRFGATGRLSSLREGLVGVMSLAAGPIGGWLAVRALGWTAGAGALILFSFVPVTALLYREPRGARGPGAAVLAAARQQLRAVVGSRTMWAASGLLFLVYLAPGFQTPLLYYQQDVLGFEPGFMGTLQLAGGAGALCGAGAYGLLCRRFSLRTSLLAGIVLNAGSTLFYLGYGSRSAALIITTAGAALGTLATLPLYDLAVRATPAEARSFGYALMLSVQNLSALALSDPLGSYLYGRVHLGFKWLVWINAGSTLAVLLFIPLLPRLLLSEREGEGHRRAQRA